MTMQRYDTHGNPVELTREQLLAEAKAKLENLDLPADTDDTRALAGSPTSPGEWWQLNRITGPKDLGLGDVYAVEFTGINNDNHICYFGGLVAQRLKEIAPYVLAGVPIYFRYVWNPYEKDDNKGQKQGFYAIFVKVQDDYPLPDEG